MISTPGHGFSEGASVEPRQPGSAGGPRSLAAVLGLEPGLAFVGSNRLARFGGLLHLGLRLDDIETFLAAAVVADHPTASLTPPLDRNDVSPLPPAPAASEPLFEVEDLHPRAEPGPQQGLRRQRRDVVGGAQSSLAKPTEQDLLRLPWWSGVADKQLAATIPWLKRPGYCRSLSSISAQTTIASVWAIAVPRSCGCWTHFAPTGLSDAYVE